MGIKNILCDYSGNANRGSGLRHGLKLAEHHDAWLTGVLRHGRPVLEKRFELQVPDDVLEKLRQSDAARIRAVKDRFDDLVLEKGRSQKSEFIDLDPRDGLALSEFARSFDLVVTGNHSEDLSEEHMTAHPDLIALRSGRPVLVVPNGYEAPGLAEHALVAWDGKRSAARAVGDAMSILEEKAKVTVLTIGRSAPATVPGGGIVTALQRHGINAGHLHRHREGKTVAETIESVADEIDARLIIMGAYEHSKFAQDIFGGVTNEVLKTARVPVFLAH